MSIDNSGGEAVDSPTQESEPPLKKKMTAYCPAQTTLPGYKCPGACLELKTWKEEDTLLVYQHGPVVHRIKIASFDMDNTIIETASGKKFATGPTDWKLMTRVASKLRSLVDEGFRVVFVTNQLGISKGKPTKADFKKKVESIATSLQIPLLLLASTTKDIYRKPCTGMWDHLVLHENGPADVDMKFSFYVGDAAGREAGWMPGIIYIFTVHKTVVRLI